MINLVKNRSVDGSCAFNDNVDSTISPTPTKHQVSKNSPTPTKTDDGILQKYSIYFKQAGRHAQLTCHSEQQM